MFWPDVTVLASSYASRPPDPRGGPALRAAALASAAAALLCAALRPLGGFVGGAQPAAGARPGVRHRLRAGRVTEGDEFQAARDRIRRIQLGLGPDDPLPPEDEPLAPAEPEDDLSVQKGDLSLAPTGDDDGAPAAASMSGGGSKDEPVIDAFAGEAKDVPELQPEKKDEPVNPNSKNFFQLLAVDVQKITVPEIGEVATTFGIVIGISVAYTIFVAVVDYGSQQALGTFFKEFYDASRPDESGF
ncbi:unnamed protein product [Prorocentrum cordatum]|uniref:Uncharacterized protein n=1 Tax=Prorocentrum cordatum TaxID=2364126 RepID=A0ABN9RXL9_9DINO|nr:unnamed protein product [Polarella glacialis]